MNQEREASGHFHAVRFYDGPDALCKIVGEFLGEGLAQGEPTVVIATPDHTARIEECLRQRALDVASLKRLGELVTLDAHETLGLFMVDGMPNAALFQEAVGEQIMQLDAARRSRSRLRRKVDVCGATG